MKGPNTRNTGSSTLVERGLRHAASLQSEKEKYNLIIEIIRTITEEDYSITTLIRF